MKKYTFLLLVPLFFACQQKSTVDEKAVKDIKAIELAGGGDLLINTTNQFGLDIFQKIIASEPADKNVFISPTSISLALAMTWNGARSSTADSMAYALRLPDLTRSEINTINKMLMEGLTSADEKVQLNIANSIWYRQSSYIEPDFISINQNFYDAQVKGLDFSDPASKDEINTWVENKTNSKIKNLISRIDPEDLMLLINAIYFKGAWQIKFDKAKTTEAQFELADGSQKAIPMMNMEDTINYFSNDVFQAAELDYGRGNYSMVILLPKTGKSTNDIIQDLSPSNWNSLINSLHKTDIILSLPRFKFEYEKDLNDILTAMGMGIAFSSDADFTGINRNGGLQISLVKHKSFVEVNEEGTEAAAATVVIITDTAFFDNIMNVNKPFVFVIREKSTGSIVFVGRFSGPND